MSYVELEIIQIFLGFIYRTHRDSGIIFSGTSSRGDPGQGVSIGVLFSCNLQIKLLQEQHLSTQPAANIFQTFQ
jgi:hypothetical protein